MQLAPRRIALTLLVAGGSAGLGVSAVGCGDDDKREGASKADYVARADAFCESRRRPADPRASDPDLKVRSRYLLQEGIPRREDYVARLRRIEAPDDLRARVDRFLAAYERVTAVQRRLARAYLSGPRQQVDRGVAEVDQGAAVTLHAAAEVGYRKCGQPRTGPPVTPADFESKELVRDADAACAKANEAVFANAPASYEDPRALAAANARTLPVQRQALEALRALRPRATKLGYAQFLAAEEQRYRYLVRGIAAGRAGDQAEQDRLAAEDAKVYAQNAPLARRLGFEVCGTSSPVGF